MGAVEKIHKAQAKEYEKVLKVREDPSLLRPECDIHTTMADHLEAP
jgi:hypothetical protein